MLFSIALAPGVLNPSAAHSPTFTMSMLSVLEAVAQNGILLAPSTLALKQELMQFAAAIGPKSHRLQIFTTDLAKDIDRYGVSAAQIPSGKEHGGPLEHCVAAAHWGKCDAILVIDEVERRRCLADHGCSSEVLLLDEFAGSALDKRRRQWLKTQRLDDIAYKEAVAIVGGAMRYAKKITVADKMIGTSIKQNHEYKDNSHQRVKKVRPYVRGIDFLIASWQSVCPAIPITRVVVEIVTVAGRASGRSGTINPAELSAAITTAANEVGLSAKIGALAITLKQDRDPPIFNDRLLACRGRVWGLHHGLDYFGKLGQSEHHQPTMIDPASDARGSVFRDLLALPNACPNPTTSMRVTPTS